MKTQQICTFFLDETCFGIRLEDVQEVIRQQPLTRIPLASPDICGLMNLRGQVIPVVDLPRRLGLRSTACNIDEQITYNIIVKTAEDVVSFIIDEIGDVLHCSIETLKPPPATLHPRIRSFLKGTYKLDQSFLLVLDIPKILNSTAN
ncbi:MAG TPA: chemotaxis protein CheW [Leptolyngbya sp.]|jgi:purine-binding chemotaxis protein CheW|nr:chemotaxis protein CheW [Leptolyngbya sp.]